MNVVSNVVDLSKIFLREQEANGHIEPRHRHNQDALKIQRKLEALKGSCTMFRTSADLLVTRLTRDKNEINMSNISAYFQLMDGLLSSLTIVGENIKALDKILRSS